MTEKEQILVSMGMTVPPADHVKLSEWLVQLAEHFRYYACRKGRRYIQDHQAEMVNGAMEIYDDIADAIDIPMLNDAAETALEKLFRNQLKTWLYRILQSVIEVK